jgi:membrane-associated protein
MEFFETLMNSEKLIHYGGLTLLLIIVFAETGFFFGFFLPGDYLLFTAGILCGTKDLNVSIETLTLSVIGAAILGDYTGYFSGRFFGKKFLERTNFFFQKYGKATLILGRYFPIVRTFGPIIAGITKMDFKYFSLANITGGILWVTSLIPLGYYVGKNHPDVINYIGYIVLGFFIITLLPFIKVLWSQLKAKTS